jgi:hypothetical protein
MNYALDIGEIGSGDLIYIRSFTKTGSAIQKVIRGGAPRDTQTQAYRQADTDNKVIS